MKPISGWEWMAPYSSSEKVLSPAFPYLAEAWEEQWPHWLEFYRGGKRRQAID